MMPHTIADDDGDGEDAVRKKKEPTHHRNRSTAFPPVVPLLPSYALSLSLSYTKKSRTHSLAGTLLTPLHAHFRLTRRYKTTTAARATITRPPPTTTMSFDECVFLLLLYVVCLRERVRPFSHFARCLWLALCFLHHAHCSSRADREAGCECH